MVIEYLPSPCIFMLEMVNALTAEDWYMFKTMKKQGTIISEIARRTEGIRKTVRKYIAMEKPAKYSREGRQSIIAPYTDYVWGGLTSITSLLCKRRLNIVHFRRNKTDPDRRFNFDPLSHVDGDQSCTAWRFGE